MRGVEVTLPGGLLNGDLLNGGRIERHSEFRPLTGRLEQELIELETQMDRPGYVTAVLDSVLDNIGNQSADSATAAKLCVADRQYLMLRLAAMLSGDQMWLNVSCGQCDAMLDVDVRRSELPVKQAGRGFPQVALELGEQTVSIRVPTGSDQERIAGDPEQDAMKQLLHTCVRSENGEPPDKEFFNSLSESDFQAIDTALDEMSPAVCDQLLVKCPECGREQRAALDHYALADISGRVFYDEVHTLASHYHWSEAAILDLPKSRRRLYLELINWSAGMTGQD